MSTGDKERREKRLEFNTHMKEFVCRNIDIWIITSIHRIECHSHNCSLFRYHRDYHVLHFCVTTVFEGNFCDMTLDSTNVEVAIWPELDLVVLL